MQRHASLTLSQGTVVVLGDLHLTGEARPLGNQGTPQNWLPFLDAMLARTDHVVLNGDIFDLERGVLPFSLGRELARAEQRHAALLALLRQPHVHWLVGNHDRKLLGLGQAGETLDLDLPQGRVRIEHGDRFNPAIKRIRPLTTSVTWVSGRAVSLGMMPVYRLLRTLERVLTRERPQLDAPGPIESGGLDWLETTPPEQPALRGLILGHTHRAGVWPRANHWVANPGDCVSNRVGWLEIDVRSGLVTIWRQDLQGNDGPQCQYAFDVLDAAPWKTHAWPAAQTRKHA